MKRGDRVVVQNGDGVRAGTIVAGPKPVRMNKKRVTNFYDIDCKDGFIWAYPEERISLAGGDYSGEGPPGQGLSTPDEEEPNDMAYEREKDDALMEGVHDVALD